MTDSRSGVRKHPRNPSDRPQTRTAEFLIRPNEGA